MILGAIGDDFTGSSDLANTLARGGMACVQYCGLPDRPALPGVQAGVVALKSRTVPADSAVAQSLAALDWLLAQGCEQILFKYCSTFDSTDKGNIGPVAAALADRLKVRGVVICPAFPATGRTVYQGYLFVGDVLLSESSLRDHPLTPMRDPDLRRVLVRQLPAGEAVGHVPYRVVTHGVGAIRDALAAARERFIVVDALTEGDLMALGAALAGAPLVTGGSGVALGLPANFGARPGASKWQPVAGPVVAIAGSVSATTRVQVEAHAAAGHPLRMLDPARIMAGDETAAELADWALTQPGVPLIASSAKPEAVAAVQAAYGTEPVSAALEGLMGDLAAELARRGACGIVAAGGETSGAIVLRLGVAALEIGPEIDPGVPLMRVPETGLALALKSGNFGASDFFIKAAARMQGMFS